MFIPPAVIDTNIFVAAAFNPDSSSAALIEAIERDELQLVWNRATRSETMAVLRQIPPIDHRRFRPLFVESGCWDGPIHPERFEAVPDPDDRVFAALAEVTATIVVSNDSDLLAVRQKLSILVETPSQFATRIFGSSQRR